MDTEVINLIIRLILAAFEAAINIGLLIAFYYSYAQSKVALFC